VLLTSTRKYRYKMAPSRAETKYKSTMALANGAEGAVRKRPGKEPGRAQTGAHCRQRLVSDRAKHRNRHQTMNHQQRDPHHARRWFKNATSDSGEPLTAAAARAARAEHLNALE
jgi:hypothetical protein